VKLSARLRRLAVSAGIQVAILLQGACSPYQSTQNPAGPQAERLYSLWIFHLIVAVVVFLAVIGATVFATRRAARSPESLRLDDVGHGKLTRAVTVATGITVLILFVSFIHSLTTGRAIASLPAKSALTIHVTGVQWWWDVEYVDTVPSRRVLTANEIHVPVGVPVQIIATARDVIHSFWVPNLHGKKDLIPGHTTATWFQADTAGLYRGQCAEFCGHQHAKMALWVVAEPREAFEKWYASQLQTPPPPADSLTRAGQDVFLSKSCAMCHNIGGTLAGSHVGPDLTHLASRRSIAAGTLPNTRANLTAWIRDPQSIKPGSRMPRTDLSSADLSALVAYLESLK
jgi:cytochrome c oxidase subunit 2